MVWFRCRDCGARFIAMDRGLIRLLTGGILAIALLLGVIWALTSRPSLDRVPHVSPVGQSSRVPAVADQLGPMSRFEVDAALWGLAEAGDPNAEYQMGLALLQWSWERDNQQWLADAADWVRRAAEQDHVRAQLVLGILHEKGRGAIQDFQAAMDWYRRAAEQGDALGMTRLGLMYKNGIGVEQDLVEAYVWLNLAAARGDGYAEHDRDSLRPFLTVAQVSAAQERSRQLDQGLPRISDTSRPLPANF